jgi:hypothetical protein
LISAQALASTAILSMPALSGELLLLVPSVRSNLNFADAEVVVVELEPVGPAGPAGSAGLRVTPAASMRVLVEGTPARIWRVSRPPQADAVS